VFSLGLINRHVGILYSKGRAAKIYDTSNRGILDVKWRGLDFSLMPHSALKCGPRIVAISGV
jgi:hypothetical protein